VVDASDVSGKDARPEAGRLAIPIFDVALGTDANEIVIEAAKTMRNNADPAEHGFVNDFNSRMLALFSGQAAN
jgi:hypothetical protein